MEEVPLSAPVRLAGFLGLTRADVRRVRDPLGAIGKAFESEREIRKQDELLAEQRARQLLSTDEDATARLELANVRAFVTEHGGRFSHTAILARARTGQGLQVVADQRGTPTSALALAPQLLALAETEAFGTYHATCRGEATWYEFALHILGRAGLAVPVTPCATAEYPRPACRPANSVLENRMLRLAGEIGDGVGRLAPSRPVDALRRPSPRGGVPRRGKPPPRRGRGRHLGPNDRRRPRVRLRPSGTAPPGLFARLSPVPGEVPWERSHLCRK